MNIGLFNADSNLATHQKTRRVFPVFDFQASELGVMASDLGAAGAYLGDSAHSFCAARGAPVEIPAGHTHDLGLTNLANMARLKITGSSARVIRTHRLAEGPACDEATNCGWEF